MLGVLEQGGVACEFWEEPDPASPVGVSRAYALHPNLRPFPGPSSGPSSEEGYVIPYLEGCKEWMTAFRVADLEWWDHVRFSVDPENYYVRLGTNRTYVGGRKLQGLARPDLKDRRPDLGDFTAYRLLVPRTLGNLDKSLSEIVAIIEVATFMPVHLSAVVFSEYHPKLAYLPQILGAPVLVVSKGPKPPPTEGVYVTKKFPKLPEGHVLFVGSGPSKPAPSTVVHLMRRVSKVEGAYEMAVADRSSGGYFVVTNLSEPKENYDRRGTRYESELTDLLEARKQVYVVFLDPHSGTLLPDWAGALVHHLRIHLYKVFGGSPMYGQVLSIVEGLLGKRLPTDLGTRKQLGVGPGVAGIRKLSGGSKALEWAREDFRSA